MDGKLKYNNQAPKESLSILSGEGLDKNGMTGESHKIVNFQEVLPEI